MDHLAFKTAAGTAKCGFTRTERSHLSAIRTVGCLSIALALGLHLAYQPISTVPSQRAAVSASTHPVPIETIRVGQRVVTTTDSSRHSTDDSTALDRRTWRLLRLEADNTWPDGTVDIVHVEAIQPPDWLATHESSVGAVIPLPLDLEEIGLPLTMTCRVLANEPCPPIAPGPGRVILATVNHLNNDVRELDVEDQSGLRETIRPTGPHRFFSVTRDSWVSARDLQPDEELQGEKGPVFVRALRKLPGAQRVYNMTVEDEHVYRVSNLGVLVHNTCPPDEINPYESPQSDLPSSKTPLGDAYIKLREEGFDFTHTLPDGTAVYTNGILTKGVLPDGTIVEMH